MTKAELVKAIEAMNLMRKAEIKEGEEIEKEKPALKR